MCGIAGFIQTSLPVPQREASIREMLGYIAHRGPDEGGYYLDEQVALGAVRLKIIDLLSGRQPISDAAQRYWIAYNGEVYNYKELRAELSKEGYPFQTSSDTEVVLAAWIHWGPACFTRLNGAYAFAIYDAVEKELVLARDRYGQRPLYYAAHDGGVLFASEMKCFLAYPGFDFQFDQAALASIFSVWTPLPAQTPFQGARQLPMGCWMRIKANSREIYEYEALDLDPPPFKGSEAEATAITREKLTQSVRLRLRSDVEIGTYLSGGLDSAIVTQLALEQGLDRLHSFSVSFEETAFDEGTYQKILNQKLGTIHTRISVSNYQIAQAFAEAVWHAETPQFRTAQTPMFLLSKAVQAAGIKVVLTGEGADESFLGYNIFKETLLRTNWNNQTEIEKRKSLTQLYPYLPHFSSANEEVLLGLYQRFSEEKEANLFSHELRIHTASLARRLLQQSAGGLEEIKKMLLSASGYANLSPIQKAQFLEFKTLLGGYLLSSQGDRMSLAHGVENRAPFLDGEVVKWAAGLPQEWKLSGGQIEKYILKQAFKDLPVQITKRAKQPYRAPDAKVFFEAKQPDYLALLFSESELKKVDGLDLGFALRLIAKLKKRQGLGISPREDQAFILLLSLVLLHRFFVQRQKEGNIAEAINWVKTINKTSFIAAIK